MNIRQGLKLLEEKKGYGHVAELGDHLIYNLRVYFNHGEEIPINDLSKTTREKLNRYCPGNFTNEEGCELINFNTCLGRRDVLRGIEYSLYGMREGGYRKVKVSPQLAYKMKGIPGKIPPNAAIIFEIWLRKIEKKETKQAFPC